jgi:hypothetical protein
MPNCCYTSFRYTTQGGVDPATNSIWAVPVDIRTFKSYQLQDGATAACGASKHVVSAQDTDIVQLMSSMTHTDKVSGTPQHQGGHLWSKPSQDLQSFRTLIDNLSLSLPKPWFLHLTCHSTFAIWKGLTFPVLSPLEKIDWSLRSVAWWRLRHLSHSW